MKEIKKRKKIERDKAQLMIEQTCEHFISAIHRVSASFFRSQNLKETRRNWWGKTYMKMVIQTCHMYKSFQN